MPYIIMKRDDIPAATLQVLDLDPNTSLRNLTLDVPGQTKYVNPVRNDAPVVHDPQAAGDECLRPGRIGGRLLFLPDLLRPGSLVPDQCDGRSRGSSCGQLHRGD